MKKIGIIGCIEKIFSNYFQYCQTKLKYLRKIFIQSKISVIFPNNIGLEYFFKNIFKSFGINKKDVIFVSAFENYAIEHKIKSKVH